MKTHVPLTQVQFAVEQADISPQVHFEAEQKAKEAYVMTLLRHGEISSGRAAHLLGISRLEAIERMSDYGISVFDDSMTLEELQDEVAQTNRLIEQHSA
jgi:predicted HTH domain antitoxin